MTKPIAILKDSLALSSIAIAVFASDADIFGRLEGLGQGHRANEVLRRIHPRITLEADARVDLVLVLLGVCRRRPESDKNQRQSAVATTIV